MEERLARRDLHCPVCRAEVEPSFLVCPVCTTKLKQACASCGSPLEALWQICPYCETPVDTPTVVQELDTWETDEPPARRAAAGAPRRSPAAEADAASRLAARGGRADADPGQAGRGRARARRRDRRAASSGAGFELRAARLARASTVSSRRSTTPSTARSRSSASSSSSSPRRRRSRSCSRARARSRSRGRRSARRTRRRRRPGRSAATSRSRCRTTSCTAPTRPSPREREIALWFPRRACLSVVAQPSSSGRAPTRSTPASARGDAWAREEIGWGICNVPEAQLGVLPAARRASTSSSSAAAPRTSPPGSRGGARARSASTRRRRSSRRRARCSASSGSSSRSFRPSAEDVPLPDESFDLAVSEYGASIWSDPYRWIPEAARLLRPGRAARLPPQLDARDALLARRRAEPSTRLKRPQFGDAPLRVARTAASSSTSATATGSACSAPAASRSRTSSSSRRRRMRTTTRTTTSSRPSGRGAGRARRSGRRASARERAAGAADPARVHLAAAARDPRSSSGFPSTSSRRATRSTTRPTPTPVELVREHARGKARSVAAEAGDRPVLGVDTTVVARRPRLRQAATTPARPSAMLEALAGRTHVVVSGLCLVTPGWEERRARRDARHLPFAHAARPRAVPGERRVGGPRGRVRDPGPRRRARRAHRGRLPQRRRPAGRPARAPAGRALPGRVRLRLDPAHVRGLAPCHGLRRHVTTRLRSSRLCTNAGERHLRVRSSVVAELAESPLDGEEVGGGDAESDRRRGSCSTASPPATSRDPRERGSGRCSGELEERALRARSRPSRSAPGRGGRRVRGGG